MLVSIELLFQIPRAGARRTPLVLLTLDPGQPELLTLTKHERIFSRHSRQSAYHGTKERRFAKKYTNERG